MGRGKKWRRDEDVSLATAYAAVASSGVKDGPFFWDAVRSQVQSVRSVRALRNRWVLMSHEVKVFVQYLDRIEAQGASGEVAAVERAMRNFRETKGRDFEFMNCWDIVRKCYETKRGGGEGGGGEAEETEEEIEEGDDVGASIAQKIAADSAEAAEYEVQTPVGTAVAVEKEERTKAGTKTKRAASLRTTLPAMDDLTFVQQQLVSEMRRKNDLQEDELALKLFGEGRESNESQQFFKLLKRKKLLLLEKEVEELETAQQRQGQRRC